jgi:hypothetical protein
MAIYDSNSNQHSDGSDSIATEPSTQYTIKIAGSGTREDIAKELRDIADAIFHPTSMGHGKNLCIDDEEWENPTLLTEIKLIL